MGLDQYVDIYKEPKKEQIKYWRKHNAMHGWMEELYRKRGGTGDFNCIPLRLTSEDLDDLENDIIEGNLPETSGFFFGSPSHEQSQEDMLEDLKFIQDAREAILNDMVVEYYAWW
jgi:hypothetical protein